MPDRPTERLLTARQGDVFVVSYPECKLPLATRYATIAIGGLIYTRQLNQGDDVAAEYDRIYTFLRGMAERDAREKVKLWTEEMAAARTPPPLPPKPAGAGAPTPQHPQSHPQPERVSDPRRPKPTTTGNR